MDNLKQISTKICDFLKEQILAEGVAIQSDTPLSEIGVDSFSLIEIVLFIEREYGIALADDSLSPENLVSVESFAKNLLTQV